MALDLEKLSPAPWTWVKHFPDCHVLEDGSGEVVLDDGSASSEYTPRIDAGGDDANFICLARAAFDGDPEALTWWEANRRKRDHA